MSSINYQYAQATPDGEYWGLIDKSGTYIVSPEYVTLHSWQEGMLRLTKKKSKVVIKDGAWQNQYNGEIYYINARGEFINSTPYDYGLDFSEGLAGIVKEGKWGFIFSTGDIAIDLLFQETYSFKEGLSAAKYDNKWGFIDKKGDWAIDPVYESVQSFAFGLAVVEKKGDYFVINKSADKVVQIPDGYPWVVIKSKNIILYGTISGEIGLRYYGFMDIEGTILSEPVFYVESEYLFDLHHYSEGMLIVSNEEDKYGYLNEQGQLHIPCLYDSAQSFDNGYAVVRREDQRYRIDKSGKLTEIIEPDYPFDEVQDFHNGLAAARKGDKWGFINPKGEMILDVKYQAYPPHKEGIEAGYYLAELFPRFSCGLLPILKSDGTKYSSGFIDNTGKVVISTDYLFVKGFEDVDVR